VLRLRAVQHSRKVDTDEVQQPAPASCLLMSIVFCDTLPPLLPMQATTCCTVSIPSLPQPAQQYCCQALSQAVPCIVEMQGRQDRRPWHHGMRHQPGVEMRSGAY
jgi:hypothetical protein